ncbi:hypothetical protein [Streptomyces sp. NPDC005385]|uniref:hypothetical protein n=1 Tax=Streptomyces sp. NPDC005385 TaxID=3157039 RepID=UPI0033A76267
MTAVREARYWTFEGDFGLTLLLAMPRADPARMMADSDAADARALLHDVRLLLDAGLQAQVLRNVWVSTTALHQDPGPGVHDLLRRIEALCEDRASGHGAGSSPGDPFPDPTPPTVTVDETAVRAAVQTEVRALSARLSSPDVVSALRQVVEVDADLGFRLVLRTVKAASASVSLELYDRYQEIGEVFGYPDSLVHDGLDVRWPRFDDVPLRRRFVWDFGFSFLVGRFHGDLWQHSYSVDQGIRGVATDYAGVVPGSAAYALLEDTLRLSRSAMSDDALAELWRVATALGYDPQGDGAGPRQWLARVAAACADGLREVDPGFTVGATGPVSPALLAPVLREVREIGPALTQAVHDSPWFGADASPWFALSAGVVPLLEQVVTEVDPDLGFRLLLRLVRAYSVSVTEEQYIRYSALGNRLGYGRNHVVSLADPNEGRE